MMRFVCACSSWPAASIGGDGHSIGGDGHSHHDLRRAGRTPIIHEAVRPRRIQGALTRDGKALVPRVRAHGHVPSLRNQMNYDL